MTTRAKRTTKLDRLLDQGKWVASQIDGKNLPCRFLMPSDELQAELEKELEKQIKKDLKAKGYELLHATRRDHPFHSDLLREKVDKLARDISIIDHKRGIWSRLYFASC